MHVKGRIFFLVSITRERWKDREMERKGYGEIEREIERGDEERKFREERGSRVKEEDGRDFFQPYFLPCAQEEVDEKTYVQQKSVARWRKNKEVFSFPLCVQMSTRERRKIGEEKKCLLLTRRGTRM